MRQAILALLLLLTPAHSAMCSDTAGDLESLRRLLIERLALMEQVAAYKWNAGLPIDDPAREANVLKAALARSRAAGLDPATARRFTVAQMEAAKVVQRHYFRQWRENAVETIAGVPDLKTDLRPKIGALSADLIEAIAASRARLAKCAAVSILTPVPETFLHVPSAWAVAVEGVLQERVGCP